MRQLKEKQSSLLVPAWPIVYLVHARVISKLASGLRLLNAVRILAIVELSRRLHQAYRFAYDKQVADWLLPQNSGLDLAITKTVNDTLSNPDCAAFAQTILKAVARKSNPIYPAGGTLAEVFTAFLNQEPHNLLTRTAPADRSVPLMVRLPDADWLSAQFQLGWPRWLILAPPPRREWSYTKAGPCSQFIGLSLTAIKTTSQSPPAITGNGNFTATDPFSRGYFRTHQRLIDTDFSRMNGTGDNETDLARSPEFLGNPQNNAGTPLTPGEIDNLLSDLTKLLNPDCASSIKSALEQLKTDTGRSQHGTTDILKLFEAVKAGRGFDWEARDQVCAGTSDIPDVDDEAYTHRSPCRPEH